MVLGPSGVRLTFFFFSDSYLRLRFYCLFHLNTPFLKFRLYYFTKLFIKTCAKFVYFFSFGIVFLFYVSSWFIYRTLTFYVIFCIFRVTYPSCRLTSLVSFLSYLVFCLPTLNELDFLSLFYLTFASLVSESPDTLIVF